MLSRIHLTLFEDTKWRGMVTRCRHTLREKLIFFMTLGAYDMVLVIDVPDDETGANISLSLRSLGNLHVVTLRAFQEEVHRQIIAALL